MPRSLSRLLIAALTCALLSTPGVALAAGLVPGGTPEVDGSVGARPAKTGAARLPEFHIVFPQPWEATQFDATFGVGRPGGRSHQGNDLMAPKHTAVFAVADGVVTRMGNGPRSGRYLVVDHGGGWTSWFMHLNNDRPGTDDGRALPDQTYAAGLVEGSFVTGGQLIGYVGDSGNAEAKGTHTHLELHHRGRPVNPHPFLIAAFERARRVSSLERIANLMSRVE